MQASAVVLDLDGTLLNSKKEVSARNLKAVLNCRRHGIPVVIATARPPRSVKVLLPPELHHAGLMIYYNGALIIDEKMGIREHCPIHPSVTSAILHYLMLRDHPPLISVEVEDRWYSNRELDHSSVTRETSKPTIVELEYLSRLSASKILISKLDAVGELIERFGHLVHILVTDSGELIQMMSKEASKENAVGKICKRLGVSVDRVMAFGDDVNDIGLFQLCGYPVAMGNAIPQLKELAYAVTETNDEDGVAVVLEQIFHH